MLLSKSTRQSVQAVLTEVRHRGTRMNLRDPVADGKRLDHLGGAY